MRNALAGAPADVVVEAGDLMEAAQITARAAVAALLPHEAALKRLPAIRAHAAAELRDAHSDLSLSLTAQRTEVRGSGAPAPAAARGARVGQSSPSALALDSRRRCTKLRLTPPALSAPGGASGRHDGRRELRGAARAVAARGRAVRGACAGGVALGLCVAPALQLRRQRRSPVLEARPARCWPSWPPLTPTRKRWSATCERCSARCPPRWRACAAALKRTTRRRTMATTLPTPTRSCAGSTRRGSQLRCVNPKASSSLAAKTKR